MGIYDEDTRRMARKLGQKPGSSAKKTYSLGQPVTLASTGRYSAGQLALLKPYAWKAGRIVQVGGTGTSRAAQVLVEFHHDRVRLWLRKDTLRLD